MTKLKVFPHHEAIAEEICGDKTIFLHLPIGIGTDVIIDEYLKRNINKKIILVFSAKIFLEQFNTQHTNDIWNHKVLTHQEFIRGEYMETEYLTYENYEIILLEYGHSHNQVNRIYTNFNHNKMIFVNPHNRSLKFKKPDDIELKLYDFNHIRLLERKHKLRHLIKITK